MLGRPVAAASRGVDTLRVVDALHRWRGRDASLDARAAASVLTGTLTRTAAASAVDGAGVTYTAPPHHPRWEVRDLDEPDLRAAVGLRYSTDDHAWDLPPMAPLPAEGTMAVDGVELGTAAIAGAGLYYFGRDDQTGARRWLEGTGTSYRFVHHNGVSSVASPALPGPAPIAGDRIRVVGQLRRDGAVRCWLAIGSSRAAQLSAWSAPLTLGTAWGSQARHRVNRVGSAGTLGAVWIGDLWDVLGLRDLEQLARV